VKNNYNNSKNNKAKIKQKTSAFLHSAFNMYCVMLQPSRWDY